jgi:hypothetical protein
MMMIKMKTDNDVDDGDDKEYDGDDAGKVSESNGYGARE